jgi:hypothetical protein
MDHRISGATVLAHGIGGRRDLPIPFGYVLIGGGLAVLVSFAALLWLWPASRLRGDSLVAFAAVAVLAVVPAGAVIGRRPVLRVRPGRLGWVVLGLVLIAVEIRQQGHVELLMTTGLH